MTHERPPPPARPWYNLVVREIALKGWTKTELRERSGVARTTIDNWAVNPGKPSAKAVNAVADALGIDRSQAHVLAGIVAPDAGQGEPGIDPELADWIDRKVPPEKQQELITAVREALSYGEPGEPEDEDGASGQSGSGRRAG